MGWSKRRKKERSLYNEIVGRRREWEQEARRLEVTLID